MKEYEEISGNKIFTNDEIKKLQEEENENIKKKKDFLNYRLYSIKKRQEKRIKVKESDFEGIKGKLNEIYRKYYEKLSDKKITSLEEFYDAIMISFSLYDQIENIDYFSNDKNSDKIIEFKNKLKKYAELKLQKKNNFKYDNVKIEKRDIETEKIDTEYSENIDMGKIDKIEENNDIELAKEYYDKVLDSLKGYPTSKLEQEAVNRLKKLQNEENN